MKLSKDKKHYIINGQTYARVTDVINIIRKPGLENWKLKVGKEEAERIAEETATFGDLVHQITAYNDRGYSIMVDEMLKDNAKLLPFLIAWIQWSGKYIHKWVMIEEVQWSEKYKVAGKIDRVGIFKNEKAPCIVDIKTGSLYDAIGIQLQAYKLLYNEGHQRKVSRCLAVQMPREEAGELRVKEYTGKKYEEEFKGIVKLYHQMKGR